MPWKKAVTSINMSDLAVGLKGARIDVSAVLIRHSAFIQSETGGEK